MPARESESFPPPLHSSFPRRFLPRVEDAVELFLFFRWALATAIAVLVLWPVNIPLLAFCYKVQQAPRPITMETNEFWTRSTVGALLLAVAALATGVLDYLLVVQAEIPAGPVHLVLFIAFLAGGAWLLFWMYAMEDFGPAFMLLLIYIFLPGFVLTAVNWLVGLWFPVGFAESWLVQPS
jgi:hypothetical protein